VPVGKDPEAAQAKYSYQACVTEDKLMIVSDIAWASVIAHNARMWLCMRSKCAFAKTLHTAHGCSANHDTGLTRRTFSAMSP